MGKIQTIALISIGHSPRTDIVNDFKDLWGDAYNILDIGALDDLSSEDIQSVAPVSGESELITKLRDGQVVYLSPSKLIPHLERALEKACKSGATQAIVLCTGDFSSLKSPIPLLLPNPILAHCAESILNPGDKLTVIVPAQGQVREAAERWSRRGFEVSKVIVERPFDNHQKLFDTIQNNQTIQNTQGLIADCFGFGVDFMNSIAKLYDKPIFIPRKLIAHLLLATR